MTFEDYFEEHFEQDCEVMAKTPALNKQGYRLTYIDKDDLLHLWATAQEQVGE